MDRSPDRLDSDVGDGRGETAWWEHLTKDSVRMRELVEGLGPTCSPIDAERTCREVDVALRGVYHSLHPSHAWGTPIPSFAAALAHTISAITNFSRQNYRDPGGSTIDMGASMYSFLRESYPTSAPFNGEALYSRAGDGTRDGDFVASSHGSSGGLRSGGSLSLRERLGTSDRLHSCDSQPHLHPPYGNHTTHTLSDSTKYSPGRSNSGSPSASGGALSDGCPSADESIITHSFSPTLHSPRRPRTHSRSRSVLHPSIHTGRHFDVPPPRFPDGAGPGSQHQCDVCGKAFPYPSKLKDHKHIHRPDKPLPCDQHGCLKKFKRQRELQAHKKTHDRGSRFGASKIPTQPGATREPQGAAGVSPPPVQSPFLPPSSLDSPTPPRQPPGRPLWHDEPSPKSESPDYDRSSTSPSPAPSHTGDPVATSLPPAADTLVADGQGKDKMSTQQQVISDTLHNRLNRQLFPELQQ